MAPRTGRPKTEHPKNIKLQVRVDQQTLDDLDDCAAKDKSSRSEIVRKGIRLVKAAQKKE